MTISELLLLVEEKKGCVVYIWHKVKIMNDPVHNKGSIHCMQLTLSGYGVNITIKRDYCDY